MNPMLALINSGQGTGQTPIGNAQPTTSDAMTLASQMRPLLKIINGSSNPSEVIQQLCMQNKTFKTAFETAKGMAGNDPKAAFYAAARARGIDPDEFIKVLTG